MWEIIRLATNHLKIKSPTTYAMRDRVQNIHGGTENANGLLTEIRSEISENRCIDCDNRQFCALFQTCIYYHLGRFEEAKEQALEAIKDFQALGHSWNENLTRWILGNTYLQLGQRPAATQELQQAKEIFLDIAERYQNESKYKKRDLCISFTKKIEDMIQNPLAYIIAQDDKYEYEHEDTSSCSIVFPVFSPIRAGREGPFVLENPTDVIATVSEIRFDDTPYVLYNIRNKGFPIKLHPRVYRWFLVEGNSMNLAKPIPILENDYVLTTDLGTNYTVPQPGDIIIAALYNPAQGQRAGVIKRYTTKGLQSASTDSYPNIPLENASIRGIVLAVAKPHSRSL